MQKTEPKIVNDSLSTDSQRIASVDIYRGLVMFLMLLEMVHLDSISKQLKQDESLNEMHRGFWSLVNFHTTHVEWAGCSLHDLIQPSFTFLVGCALAFSIKKRIAKGESFGRMLFHALSRSFILVALGVLLRSLESDRIVFRFDDTLCQIGLGYPFLFLIAMLPRAVTYLAIALVLVGYWVAFVAYPLPPENFDYTSVGVASEWPNHHSGLEAHWNKNSNLAWAFDRWWMNLFPREKAFSHSDGGYATLNFVPTLATMLLGLVAGNWLRSDRAAGRKVTLFVVAMIGCWGLAWCVDWAQLCPIVKRIWTPAWVLWSGGWCFGLLLFFYLIADVAAWRAWAFPLMVIGSNSIVAYVMAHTTAPFLEDRLTAWLGPLWEITESRFQNATPVFVGLITFIILWMVLYWMNKKKVHVRI
jgi:predicted acyltransferase